MPRSLRRLLSLAIVLAASLTAHLVQAQSFGFMRMPSTFVQYLGYGYGAGHQAPIVRTPGDHPERMQRVERMPRCYGTLYPVAYQPIGCYDGSCGCGAMGPAAYPPAMSQQPMGPMVPAMQGPMMQGPMMPPPMAAHYAPGYAVR